MITVSNILLTTEIILEITTKIILELTTEIILESFEMLVSLEWTRECSEIFSDYFSIQLYAF